VTPLGEWERCRGWIEAALEYAGGTHTIEDIEAGLTSGQFTFWPGQRCAIVTELNVYPRFKALNIFLVGGDLQEILEMEPHICAWAKAHGCERVYQIGRPGWKRALEAHGYQVRLLVGSMKEL